MERLKEAIARGKLKQQVIEEYKKIFKQILAKMRNFNSFRLFSNRFSLLTFKIKSQVKRKDLEKINIDDNLLLQLLELPPQAFEIYTDPVTGCENIRVKSAFLREQAKLIRCKIKNSKPSHLFDFYSFFSSLI